jgi:GxxExxY protein
MTEPSADADALGRHIVDAAFQVHRALGPGLLEAVYAACLRHELTARGLRVAAQLPVPVVYRGIRLDCGFRLDLLVEDMVVVEIKAVEQHNRLYEAQLLTYLKLANKPLGYLINFNTPLIRDGIRRFIPS